MASALIGAPTAATSQAYLESNPVRETKALITELCRQFYHLGWVSGTGGSVTIKVHDEAIPRPNQLIIMSPSGNPPSAYSSVCLWVCVIKCFDFGS